MQNYKTNLVTSNAPKLTYSDVEIQNFPGRNPRTSLPRGGRV